MTNHHELERASVDASRLADALDALVLGVTDAAVQGIVGTQATRVRAVARVLMRESLQARMAVVQQRLSDLTTEQTNLQTQITQL
jgi:hypothetical protein